MTNTPPQPTTEDWEKEFDKWWKRIEITGHISGRYIYSLKDDDDDENNYSYLDDSIKSFVHRQIDKAVQQERERCLKCVEELLDLKYPYRFVVETSYGQGQLERGVRMDTYIRRKGVYDDMAIGGLEDIRNKIKGGDKHGR